MKTLHGLPKALPFLLTLSLVALAACGGSGTAVKEEAKPTPPATAEAVKEAPLAKRYARIVLQPFAYDPQLEADYPGAVADCEKSALDALVAKRIFSSAVKEKAVPKSPDTLLLSAQVTSLRIVSNAARMWGGAFAGSSEMSLRMKLTDAATGAVVREKELSTNNNPWAAAWTWGSSDRSLPTDLGRMVAEYLAAIQPQPVAVKSAAPPVAEGKVAEATAPKPAVAVEKPVPPAPVAREAIRTLRITKNASLRAEPDTKGKLRGTLRKGDKVELLGKSGRWFNIKGANGITGWVHDSLATEQP